MNPHCSACGNRVGYHRPMVTRLLPFSWVLILLDGRRVVAAESSRPVRPRRPRARRRRRPTPQMVPASSSARSPSTGAPPAVRPLRMDADPRCVAEPGAASEVLVVGPGDGLQNVFVYVKDGLGDRRYATPTEPVHLDQQGCRYVPHVFGVQVGQPVLIANSDPTLHNVNANPKDNRPSTSARCRRRRPSRASSTSPKSACRFAVTCTRG